MWSYLIGGFLQISGEPMPSAFNFTHLFHAKRNRVEFISGNYFQGVQSSKTFQRLNKHQCFCAVFVHLQKYKKSYLREVYLQK